MRGKGGGHACGMVPCGLGRGVADSDPDPRPLRAVPLAGGAGTFTPFRYPAFSAIWIANLVSNLGSMIQSVAAAWLMTD